jgi:hypothetical protein
VAATLAERQPGIRACVESHEIHPLRGATARGFVALWPRVQTAARRPRPIGHRGRDDEMTDVARPTGLRVEPRGSRCERALSVPLDGVTGRGRAAAKHVGCATFADVPSYLNSDDHNMVNLALTNDRSDSFHFLKVDADVFLFLRSHRPRRIRMFRAAVS